jgi:hypothetical protein
MGTVFATADIKALVIFILRMALSVILIALFNCSDYSKTGLSGIQMVFFHERPFYMKRSIKMFFFCIKQSSLWNHLKTRPEIGWLKTI